MVGQAIWQNLQKLVSIDQKITNSKKEILKTQELLKKYHNELPQLEKEIKETQQILLNEKKNINLSELKAKELKEREKNKKDKLEKITNPKAYKALEKELKTISQQIFEQDYILIQAWHNLDSIKKECENKEKELQERILQSKEGIEVQKEYLKDQEKKIIELEKEREIAVKIIPEEWLVQYERMKQKVQDPIVPVISSSCSACYYSILRKDLHQLKNEGIVLCRNCYRFLYYNPEEEKEAEKENY